MSKTEVCKIEQNTYDERHIINSMDGSDMDIEGTRLKLQVLKTHLMSVAEGDRLYWSEKKHSREDVAEYQKRQDRLNEIRLEMMTLAPFTIQ